MLSKLSRGLLSNKNKVMSAFRYLQRIFFLYTTAMWRLYFERYFNVTFSLGLLATFPYLPRAMLTSSLPFDYQNICALYLTVWHFVLIHNLKSYFFPEFLISTFFFAKWLFILNLWKERKNMPRVMPTTSTYITNFGSVSIDFWLKLNRFQQGYVIAPW